MKDNTVTAYGGVEIYTSNILAFADEFIDHELDEERRQEIYTNNNIFNSMLFYISDNIDKPDLSDIRLLDDIFNIFIRLCTKYDKSPTLEKFSLLIDINPGTISDWIGGKTRNNVYYDSKGVHIKDFAAWQLNHKGEQYTVEPSTAHSETAKKWKNICGGFLIDSLQNSRGTDANKIFAAKAVYSYAETAPRHTESIGQHRTAEQIAADYGPQAALPGDVQPDF